MENKQSRLLTWMAGIFVLLVALLLFGEEPGGESDGESFLFGGGIDAADVQQISLQGDGRSQVDIAINDGKWFIDASPPIPADETAVGRLISEVTQARCGEMVSDNTGTGFGLSPAQHVVTVVLQDGQRHVLRVGADTPVDWASYVECGDGVVRTAQTKLTGFDVVLSDLRDQRILPSWSPTALSLRRVPVASGDENVVDEDGLEIHKQDAHWLSTEGLLLSSPAVERMLNSLHTTTVTEFDVEQPNERQWELTLSNGEEEVTLWQDQHGRTTTPLQTSPVLAAKFDETIPTLNDLLETKLIAADQPIVQVFIRNEQRMLEANRAEQWDAAWAMEILEMPGLRDQHRLDCSPFTHEIIAKDAFGGEQTLFATLEEDAPCARDATSGVAFALPHGAESIIPTP